MESTLKKQDTPDRYYSGQSDPDNLKDTDIEINLGSIRETGKTAGRGSEQGCSGDIWRERTGSGTGDGRETDDE